MAYKNKTIQNPVTGQQIRFIQTSKDTNGQLLEMEVTLVARSKELFAHYHPHQEEIYNVISGELTVRLDGEEMHTLQAGDSFVVAPKQVHSILNVGSMPAVVNWQVRPALEMEYFLETVMGLATDGKANKEGVPGLMQISLTAKKYGDVFRFVKPSFLVRKLLFPVVRPIALMAGYKPFYKKYLD